MSDKIKPGDPLPDISLPAQAGETVRLRDLLGEKHLVIFFYPKDGSPICTREACAFRDSYGSLRELGAEVVGISPDTPESHGAFAENHDLPFLLLSDADGEAARAFGIGGFWRVLTGRVTCVVDKDGTVQKVYSSALRAATHVEMARQALEALDSGNKG